MWAGLRPTCVVEAASIAACVGWKVNVSAGGTWARPEVMGKTIFPMTSDLQPYIVVLPKIFVKAKPATFTKPSVKAVTLQELCLRSGSQRRTVNQVSAKY